MLFKNAQQPNEQGNECRDKCGDSLTVVKYSQQNQQ